MGARACAEEPLSCPQVHCQVGSCCSEIKGCYLSFCQFVNKAWKLQQTIDNSNRALTQRPGNCVHRKWGAGWAFRSAACQSRPGCGQVGGREQEQQEHRGASRVRVSGKRWSGLELQWTLGGRAGRLANGTAFIQGRAQGCGASPPRGEDGCPQMGDPNPASKSPGTVVSAGTGGKYILTHTLSS